MSTAVFWTLSNIETLARQVSGQLSAGQFSDENLDFYINSYYQYDLPRELKIEELYTQYTFPTEVGVAKYTLPGAFTDNLAFTHVIPKIYVNGLSIAYTQDTNVYYYRTPPLFSTELMGTGNGSTTTFTYTTQFQPIVPNQPSSVMGAVITSGMSGVQFSDDGNGNLTGTDGGSGTVDYTTGVVSYAFIVAPSALSTINLTYNYEQLGPPNTCLFYERQFTFFPTPDTIYQIRIDAYFQPVALVNPTDTPVKNEWGEIIAIGAALKILRNFGQFDKYQECLIYYNREKSKLASDTDNQLMASRSPQRF